MKYVVLLYICFMSGAIASDTSKFTYVGSGRYVCSSSESCAHYKAIRDQQDRREFDRKYEADRIDRERDFEYSLIYRRADKPVREFMK